MKFVKLLIVGLLLGLVATVVTLLMPTEKAEAYDICQRWDDKVYVERVTASPSSQYNGEPVRVYYTLRTKDRPGGGQYIFTQTDDRRYYSSVASTAAVGRYGMGSAAARVGGMLIMSYNRNNDMVAECRINWNAIPLLTSVNIIPPQPSKITWRLSGGRAWNDNITITFYVSNGANGWLDFDLYARMGTTYQINNIGIYSGVGTATIDKSYLNFSVTNELISECVGGGGWFWDVTYSCYSEWYEGGGAYFTVNNNNRFVQGGNGISSLDFRSRNTNVWSSSMGNESLGPGDAESWSMNGPKQPTGGDLYNTAVANGGSNVAGLSKAGTTTNSTSLPRLDKTCASTSSFCNGWYAAGKYGSGAYAWYALKTNNFSAPGGRDYFGTASAMFINCEPEGNGRVNFKYYDYGQTFYDRNMYTRMMDNKDKTFNIADPGKRMRNSDTGLLTGFNNYTLVSSDRWDIAKPWQDKSVPSHAMGMMSSTPDGREYYQNWGDYTGELGASCAYPSARAWLPSTTTITLPASQNVNGNYLFSTAMPVRLGSLDVRGGYGSDNRTLPAVPVTVQIRGPQNINVNVYCLSSWLSSSCNNVALTKLTTPGDYTVQACWNGGVAGGGQHRVFYGSCSNVLSFKVYETFGCTFPEDAGNNITIGPDLNNPSLVNPVITGNNTGQPQIVRSGDKILVTYPNVTTNNFKGLISVPAPPAGNPQIKGRTRIVSGSDPYNSSDVRLYDASGREIDTNRGTSLEWNNGIEIANPTHYISYYWPSALTASGRSSIQIERRIWIWAQAFDPRQPITSPPVTQWWSCDTTDSPHSAWIQIINSQLTQ